MGDTGLLVTLVFALGVAVVGAVLAARLGQSVILGYILAEVVIGPYTPGFVGDPAAVKDLADVGIILLMFTIGVHLSVRDLMRAGTVALVGGVAQVLVTLGIGYAVGIAVAWPTATHARSQARPAGPRACRAAQSPWTCRAVGPRVLPGDR